MTISKGTRLNLARTKSTIAKKKLLPTVESSSIEKPVQNNPEDDLRLVTLEMIYQRALGKTC